MYGTGSTSEQKQSSYVKRFSIIAGSTLEEAECFVACLKTLQAGLNNNSSDPAALEQDFKSAMDQYARLTMVCDIFKVFNPFKTSPSPSPQTQATPLIKEEPPEIKPSLLLRMSPHHEDLRKEADLMPSSKVEPMDITPNALPILTIKRQDRVPSPVAASTTQNNSRQQPRSDEIRNGNNRSSNNTAEERRRLSSPSSSSTKAIKARSPSRDRTPRIDPLAHRPITRASVNANDNKASKPENGLTTEQYIHSFEEILTYFSNVNKLSKDSVWERLLIHSLPPEQKAWFIKNLQGKNYGWEAAKNLFLIEYSNKSSVYRHTEPNYSLERKAQYAQALLTLEMQENDDLKEFNAKFKRYSDSAGMTCDYSLLKRYVNSLAKRYRELAAPLLNMPDYVNNLYALMQQVEKLALPPPGLVDADERCSHNWLIDTSFNSSWPTVSGPQKRRAMDDAMDAVEKRVKSQPVA